MTKTTIENKSACDKACEILQATNDGNDLDPNDLYLVQGAVNGWTNERGDKAFDELHELVTSGKYRKPWLCGIEHLTWDHEGYVYWKGQHVEHFTGSAFKPGEMKHAAEALAWRCRILEARGDELSCRNVVWTWTEPDWEPQDFSEHPVQQIPASVLAEKAQANPTAFDCRCRSCGANVYRMAQRHPDWLWRLTMGHSWCPDCEVLV